MKILKTYRQLFENMIDLIQNLEREELDDKKSSFNLGEKLIYSYLYDDDDENIKSLINMNIDYEYEFLKYAYDYDRIVLTFDNDYISAFFNLEEYTLSTYSEYNQQHVPEEYIDTEQLDSYFDIDKLKNLLKINNDVDIYDILKILNFTKIDSLLDDIKAYISYPIENAKQKIANDISDKLPFEISVYYDKTKTRTTITIYLLELTEEKTIKDFLLKYENILINAENISYNFYSEITYDYDKEISKIINSIYDLLKTDSEKILKSLKIKKYDIEDIIELGGVLLDYIKTEEFQDKMIFNGDDLYNMTETYEKFKSIIHPTIKRKFKKLTTKNKFNL